MPHKRSRRLKDHKVLQDMAKRDPNDRAIFEDNVVDTFYPQRPAALEDVCLYDFIAFTGVDNQGQRVGCTGSLANPNSRSLTLRMRT